MTWTRPGAARLPPDWKRRKAATFNRDGHRCVALLPDGSRCPATSNLECDHAGDRDNHELDNLRTLCHRHHQQHTAAQSAAARPTRQRPTQQHPGMVS